MDNVDRIELHRRFGGRVVALHNDEVIASAVTYSELVDILTQSGADRRDLIIEYVEPADAIAIY
jgi:hypothetical protein